MTEMTNPVSQDADPMSQIREGMHVVDASGEDVGRVELVRMGDSEASTTAGNEEMPPPAPLDFIAKAVGTRPEPDVPEPLRSRLVRSGYLKVDGAKLFERDRYVPGAYVRGVAGDRVMLSVRRDEIAKED